jgi:hypothetical protein
MEPLSGLNRPLSFPGVPDPPMRGEAAGTSGGFSSCNSLQLIDQQGKPVQPSRIRIRAVALTFVIGPNKNWPNRQQRSKQIIVVEHIGHSLPFGGGRRTLHQQLITGRADFQLLIELLLGGLGADPVAQKALHPLSGGGWLVHHPHAHHRKKPCLADPAPHGAGKIRS